MSSEESPFRVELQKKVEAEMTDTISKAMDVVQQKLDNIQSEFTRAQERHQEEVDKFTADNADFERRVRDREEAAQLQASRDSDKISAMQLELDNFRARNNLLSTELDEEKRKLREAELRHQELHDRYSLLVGLYVTKTQTVSTRSREELSAISARAIAFTQSTSDIEPARILNSQNSDLPEGTQLIADVLVNTFIWIAPSGKVHIFDKADMQYLEYTNPGKLRLVLEEVSFQFCAALNGDKFEACDRWMADFAGWVEWKMVSSHAPTA